MRMIKKSYCKKDGWRGQEEKCSACGKKTIMKDIPDRRNGWYYIDTIDKPLISTTKVFSIINKFGLNKWRENKCIEIALFDPSLSPKEILARVDEIAREAGERGTMVHDYIHKLELDPEIALSDPLDVLKPYIDAYKEFRESFPFTVEYSEATIINPDKDYAGRIDVIGTNSGNRWLLDYKTSKHVHEEDGYQLSAYKNAESLLTMYKGKQNIEPMPKIDKMAVVQLKDDGHHNFIVKDEPHKIFLNHLDNYKHSSLKEYYEV